MLTNIPNDREATIFNNLYKNKVVSSPEHKV